MAKLIIVAAGNGARMGAQMFPKVLHPILGSTNLERTYGYAYDLFDEICVVVKMNDKKTFERFKMLNKMDKLTIVPIASGKGDGHAVMEGLANIYLKDPDAILMWGDAVLEDDLILREILEIETDSPFVFPVRLEELPYVWFQQDEDGVVCSANFSKKSEVISEGYHDQSIFKIKVQEVFAALKLMNSVLLRNDVYFGGELNFLHLVHFFYNMETPAEMYETEFKVFSFNTVLEAEQVNKFLVTKV